MTRSPIAAIVAAVVMAGSAMLAGVAAAQAPPARIISLVPAVTEILFAIGAGPQVVAVSSYNNFPEQVKALPRVGALLDPDVERILALRPQLVVSYGSQTDLQAQLGRAGIAVYNYRHTGLAGIFDAIRGVGRASGRREEAERLAGDIETKMDAIRTRVQGRRRPRTLLVFERDPTTLRGIYVSGGRGFLHDMLEVAGGENVFAVPHRFDSASWVGCRLAEILPVPLAAKQKLMELDDALMRLKILHKFLVQHRLA